MVKRSQIQVKLLTGAACESAGRMKRAASTT
jgi:hypothetical protein